MPNHKSYNAPSNKNEYCIQWLGFRSGHCPIYIKYIKMKLQCKSNKHSLFFSHSCDVIRLATWIISLTFDLKYYGPPHFVAVLSEQAPRCLHIFVWSGFRVTYGCTVKHCDLYQTIWLKKQHNHSQILHIFYKLHI